MDQNKLHIFTEFNNWLTAIVRSLCQLKTSADALILIYECFEHKLRDFALYREDDT